MFPSVAFYSANRCHNAHTVYIHRSRKTQRYESKNTARQLTAAWSEDDIALRSLDGV